MLKKLLSIFIKKDNKSKSSSSNNTENKQLSAATVAENATFAVKMVEELDGAKLNFSVESLKDIDRILQGFHNNGDTSSSMPGTATVFGCYVGEVIVRNLNGKWVDSIETPAAHLIQGNIPLVQLESGYIANPIGKVFNEIDNGFEDNVVWFYHVTKQNA